MLVGNIWGSGCFFNAATYSGDRGFAIFVVIFPFLQVSWPCKVGFFLNLGFGEPIVLHPGFP